MIKIAVKEYGTDEGHMNLAQTK